MDEAVVGCVSLFAFFTLLCQRTAAPQQRRGLHSAMRGGHDTATSLNKLCINVKMKKQNSKQKLRELLRMTSGGPASQRLSDQLASYSSSPTNPVSVTTLLRFWQNLTAPAARPLCAGHSGLLGPLSFYRSLFFFYSGLCVVWILLMINSGLSDSDHLTHVQL